MFCEHRRISPSFCTSQHVPVLFQYFEQLWTCRFHLSLRRRSVFLEVKTIFCPEYPLRLRKQTAVSTLTEILKYFKILEAVRYIALGDYRTARYQSDRNSILVNNPQGTSAWALRRRQKDVSQRSSSSFRLAGIETKRFEFLEFIRRSYPWVLADSISELINMYSTLHALVSCQASFNKIKWIIWS